MTHFIWLDKDTALNMDKIVKIEFCTEKQYIQDGRKTWYFEDVDESKPFEVCGEQDVAEVSLDFVEGVDRVYAPGSEMVQAVRNYRGERATALKTAISHLAAAW